jgi:hypothetical protein
MHLGFLHRLMHRYWRLSRGQTVDVCVLAIDEDGRVFLAGDGTNWHLPAAPIRPGQSSLDAVAQLLAEQGIQSSALPPTLSGLHRAPPGSQADHAALYVVRNVSPARRDGESAGGFFSPDALPKAATAATRDVIAAAMHR